MTQESPEATTTARRTSGRKREAPKPKPLLLPSTISVKQLAEIANLSAVDVIKQLMRNGIMASMNDFISFDVALLVTSAFGIPARPQHDAPDTSASVTEQAEEEADLGPRPPVIAILGHVDHGKTTLLDTIRLTQVAETEMGHITQHIGAYQVAYQDKRITFLDTPGHEAFTAIRTRGAQATDIAVLVVAADDGVMPQTIEAADHAKAANVPIVVAITKMDTPGADPDKVKRQLADHALLVEEWGGDIIAVPISAVNGEGTDELLDTILIVAEVAELKANPHRKALGVIIESKLNRSMGPIASVLVQSGTLNIGDHLVAGTTRGRVKALMDDRGERVQSAIPSDPVEVMGFDSLPTAGEVFTVVASEKDARALVESRLQQADGQHTRTRGLALEEVHTGISSGEIKELLLVLKADVQGSTEAVSFALERLEGDNVKVRVIHAGSGTVTESDVLLASASNAIILGFNTTAEPSAERLAERDGVDIRHYNIIYRLTEDVEKALAGMLEPVQHEVLLGRAEVKAIFSAGRSGTIAGCMVTEGRLTRGGAIKVVRDSQIIHEGRIASLRHFKEDVTEVGTGLECGVGIASYADFQEGDIIEAYRIERART